MSKSTKISDFWYTQAQNLMGERTGLYSVKAVIERAIEEMDKRCKGRNCGQYEVESK